MEIIKFENFKSDIPQGWINVKLDNQLYKRMNRYVYTLDKIVGTRYKYDLYKKIDSISNIDRHIDDPNLSIQSKISIITILQYLKELKVHFDPSSSGFLLEGFLATLIHGKLEEGRKPFDISSSYSELDAVRFKSTGGRGITYQIKLYKMGHDIKVNMSEICDYYVICLKDNDDIWVHILDGKDPNHPQFIGGPLAAQYLRGYRIHPNQAGKVIPKAEFYIRNDGAKNYMVINTNKLRNNPLKKKLEMGNLDELIKKCGDNIMQSINDTYVKLSELHYNIDSLVSGVDKNQQPINVDDAKNQADQTLSELSQSILRLSEDINS